MTKEDLDRLWRDERNWGHGWMGAYFCKEDPRLIVPKHHGLPGGTFNMAHRWAVPLLTAGFVLFLVLFIAAAFGFTLGRR